MDYQKIYTAFIADRRTTEDAAVLLSSYLEKHHIVPRSLGGGNEPSNLIRLTPEDHFFAHLLLAKTHGGELWAPIAFMVGGSRKDYRPTHSRKAHGWAARTMAKARSGENAYQFDHTIYSLVHQDGRKAQVLQSEMHTKLGLGKPLANLLVKGKVSIAKGWYFEGTEPKSLLGDKHPMHRPEVHEFRHVKGEVFVGTQLQFSDAMKFGRPAVSNLVRGHRRVTKGWYMAAAGFPELKMGSRWAKLLEN